MEKQKSLMEECLEGLETLEDLEFSGEIYLAKRNGVLYHFKKGKFYSSPNKRLFWSGIPYEEVKLEDIPLTTSSLENALIWIKREIRIIDQNLYKKH